MPHAGLLNPEPDPEPGDDSPVLQVPVDHAPVLAPPPELLGHPLSSPDFALRWPKPLFVQEARVVMEMEAAHQRLLLEEAFGDPLPVECFDQASRSSPEAGVRVLSALVEQVHALPPYRPYRPYYQQRLREQHRDPDDWEPDERDLLPLYFVQLYEDLEQRGYFVRAFGGNCKYGADSEISESGTVGMSLGWNPSWPLNPNELNDQGKLYDIIERLHDLIARPRRRFTHEPDYDCMHYVDPAPAIGRELYRWQVNELLDDMGVGLRLADDGEDAGRLVTVTDEARNELVQSMAARSDPVTGDLVRYAIHLFRKRDATDDDKRTAIEKLYQVLEPARKAGHFRSAPLTKADEDLFGIANRYAIRHGDGKADQLREYDSAYLDWLFWWYLATVELADRLSDPSRTTTP